VPTEILHIDASFPDRGALLRATAVLRAGGLVAFPTETVYGLGANALDAAAVARIFTAKGRPATNPVIVHVATIESARALTQTWPDTAQVLARRFWPGPLTMVLPKNERVPDIVTAGGPTLALRIPAHPVALELLETCELPLAAPSANRSSELSPTRGEHVLRSLADRIELLLDAGATTGGLESTVIDLTATPPRLLRPGLISLAEIQAIIGAVELGQHAPDAGQSLPSPGMLPRHYAPRTPLELAGGSARQRVAELCCLGRRVGWVSFIREETVPGAIHVELPADPIGCAAQLYAVLHELDGAGLEHIVVAAPPDTPEWLAIRDRLARAASGHVG